MYISKQLLSNLVNKENLLLGDVYNWSPTDCGVSLSVIKRKLQTSTLKRETGVGRRGRLKKNLQLN
jgi:hypothetical protein